MQRHPYLLILPAAALVAAAATACGSGAAKPAAPTVSPTMGTPTMGSPTAHGGVSAQDRAWLTEIHQANIAEVQAGSLAAKKGATTAVRSAGRMLSTEHTQFDDKVRRTARRLGVSLPAAVAPTDAAAAQRLRGRTGREFDQDFLSTMISGHEQAIAQTQAQISQGSSPQVVALAKEALPHLRHHLAALRKAQSSG
jgi:putative membrane protein